MTRTFNAVLLGLVSFFVVGAVVIIVNGRPVAAPSLITTAEASSNTYTMADVAAHAVDADCWSAVNGSVYDLTSWVSRHPGGANAIKAMCGSDASGSFNAQHSSFPAAQNALILLKIGTLAS